MAKKRISISRFRCVGTFVFAFLMFRFLRTVSLLSTSFSSTNVGAAAFLSGSTLFMATGARCSSNSSTSSTSNRATCSMNTSKSSTHLHSHSHPSEFPIGLGTLDITPEQVPTAIASALRLGYRRIDCAPVYFNEDKIGDALSKALARGGDGEGADTGDAEPELEHNNDAAIPREDLFVVSKLASPFHRKEHVKIGLLKTLNDLRLDYLDLYLIHWPQAFRFVDIDPLVRGYEGPAQYIDDSNNGEYIDPGVSIHETWTAMEELVEEGLVRHIGVSNFPVSLLHELMAGNHKIPPAVNQVEMHPYLQQSGLLAYCKKRNVNVQAYSPLGTSGYKGADEPTLLEDPTLRAIAAKHGITVAQVCLAWALQRGTSVVAKSATPEHQQENWESSSESIVLSDDEMAEINGLERGHRFFRPEEWWGHWALAVFD